MRVFSQPPGIQHLDNDFSTDSSTREILNCQETDDIQIFNYYNFRHCIYNLLYLMPIMSHFLHFSKILI